MLMATTASSPASLPMTSAMLNLLTSTTPIVVVVGPDPGSIGVLGEFATVPLRPQLEEGIDPECRSDRSGSIL